MIYDVLIIGGGAAGYGTALTLASVEDKFDWAKDKKYLMIDNNESDINKASFFNLSGVEFGIGGDKLLENLSDQLSNFNSCSKVNDTVTKILKEDELFIVSTTTKTFKSKIVVIATGMHKFEIICDNIEILTHNNIMKPNKCYLKNNDNKISNNLYVAGLASGIKTMFAIANGDGVKVACDIFEQWTQKKAVAHDSLKDAIV